MRLTSNVAIAAIATAAFCAHSTAFVFPEVSQHGAFLQKSILVSPMVVQQRQHRQKMVHSASSYHRSNTVPLFSAAAADNSSEKKIDVFSEVDAIFKSIDTNQDGVISPEELSNHLVTKMGYTPEYTDYLFTSFDSDDDGEITMKEMRFAFYNFEALSMYMTFGVGGSDITSRVAFQKFLDRPQYGEDSDKLVVDDMADLIFEMIDTDGSGEIDRKELLAYFEKITDKFAKKGTDSQAEEYVQTMFATLDVNQDSAIQIEEMRAAFQKYDFKLLAQTFGLRVYGQD